MHRRRFATFCLLAVPALAALSCVLPPAGVDESGTGGSGTGGSGGSGGTSPCADCIGSLCEAEGKVCAANSACYALLDCVAACSDTPCTNGCYATYPNGQADLNTYVQCVNDNCSAQCA